MLIKSTSKRSAIKPKLVFCCCVMLLVLLMNCRNGNDFKASALSAGGVESAKQLWRIDIEAWASWSIRSGMSDAGGYEYELRLQIGNPNDFPIHFDTIAIRFHRSDMKRWGELALREERIIFSQSSMYTLFFYGDERPREGMPLQNGASLEEEQLEGHRAIVLRHIGTGAALTTQPGSEPTRISIVLLHKGKEVCEPQICVLPPILRIPSSFDLAKDEKGFHLEFFPVSRLPVPSGVTDGELVRRIFDKAAAVSQDAALIEITPLFVTVNTYASGKIRHAVQAWVYRFHSKKGQFYLFKDDVGKVKWETKASKEKPAQWFHPDVIEGCKVDSDIAVLIAEFSSAEATASGSFQLEVTQIDGKERPLWRLPYKIFSRQLGILADTGEVVTSKKQGRGWELCDDVIWNQ